jgi:predicted dehydrogenase
MQTLRVGFLGFGFMGKTHLFAHKTLPFYYGAAPAAIALKSVCTGHDASARAARDFGGFERHTTDPLAILNAPDIDLVHICTPNHCHLAEITAGLRANKHLYIEKPITGTLAEAERLLALLPAYQGAAQIVFNYRFLPATLKAKALIEEGFLGPLTHFRAAYLHGGSLHPDKPVNWKSTAAAGGGVINDLGSHVVDLITHLIGPLQSLCAISRIWSPSRPDPHDPLRPMTIDAEEAAAALVRTADGAYGTLEASKITAGSEDELRFELHGRHGALRFNLMSPNYLEAFDARRPDGAHGWQRIATVGRFPAPGGQFPSPKNSVGWERTHVHSLYSFLRHITEGTPPAPSIAEAIQTQRTLDAWRRSAQSRSWIDLDR